MSYFTKFPLVNYPLGVGSSLKFVYVRNLLRRIGLSSDLKSSAGAFIEYDVKDGEKPEHIADRVYGDASYAWVVLLTNDIVNPYSDWYMSSHSLQNYIQKKYTGYFAFVATGGNFFYGSAIDAGATLIQGSVSARVLEYHPTFCRLFVDKPLSTGSATITATGGVQYGVNIHRVDDGYLSVHHFQIKRPFGSCGANEFVTVDPLTQQTNSYSMLGGFVGSTSDVYPDAVSGKDYSSTTGIVDLWETFVGGYMGISGSRVNQYAVSNTVYESELNDSKRTIKVLHPRYLPQAIKELEGLLRT
jgi:hypothetical protein